MSLPLIKTVEVPVDIVDKGANYEDAMVHHGDTLSWIVSEKTPNEAYHRTTHLQSQPDIHQETIRPGPMNRHQKYLLHQLVSAATFEDRLQTVYISSFIPILVKC